MINETLSVLLWTTAILLVISGIDDFYLDLLYWILKGRFKIKYPDFSSMHDKPEKPIAIFMGAWKESGVIGRTLSYAVQNIKYKIKVDAIYEKEFSPDEYHMEMYYNKIKNSANSENESSKNEYLDLYGRKIELTPEYFRNNEEEFSPDEYHMEMYYNKIKNSANYEKELSEEHLDLYYEKEFSSDEYHMEMYYNKMKNNPNSEQELSKEEHLDLHGRKIELTPEYFRNNEEEFSEPLQVNYTNYLEDPFSSLIKFRKEYKKPTKELIRRYTITFLAFVFMGIGFLVYRGNSDNNNGPQIGIKQGKSFFFENVYARNNDSPDYYKYQSDYAYQSNLPAKTSANENNKGRIYIDNNCNMIFLPIWGKYDYNYEVIYIPLKDGKIGIQESAWSSINDANNRLNSILLHPSLNNLNGYIVESKKINDPLFKVIVGNYNNIEEALTHKKKIREIYQK